MSLGPMIFSPCFGTNIAPNCNWTKLAHKIPGLCDENSYQNGGVANYALVIPEPGALASLIFLGAVKSGPGNAWGGKKRQSLGKTAGLGWVPAQTTPASSPCQQLCRAQPEWAQWSSASSVPAQRTSSSRMGPEPGPKRQRPGALSARPQPSRRHTTREFLMFQ